MKTFPTISFRDFEQGVVALIDLTTVYPSKVPDYLTRNKNIQEEKPLCSRCDGTGNEFFNMFRRCLECGGDGVSRENSKNS